MNSITYWDEIISEAIFLLLKQLSRFNEIFRQSKNATSEISSTNCGVMDIFANLSK